MHNSARLTPMEMKLADHHFYDSVPVTLSAGSEHNLFSPSAAQVSWEMLHACRPPISLPASQLILNCSGSVTTLSQPVYISLTDRAYIFPTKDDVLHILDLALPRAPMRHMRHVSMYTAISAQWKGPEMRAARSVGLEQRFFQTCGTVVTRRYSILFSFTGCTIDVQVSDVTARRPSKFYLDTFFASHDGIRCTFREVSSKTAIANRDLKTSRLITVNGAKKEPMLMLMRPATRPGGNC